MELKKNRLSAKDILGLIPRDIKQKFTIRFIKYVKGELSFLCDEIVNRISKAPANAYANKIKQHSRENRHTIKVL